jgi:hypothetical protein
MRTTITKTYKGTFEEVESITCNKCGTIIKPEKKKDYFWIDKIQNIELEWGFGSQYDQEIWKFDLCEVCLTELIRDFKIPPEVKR